MQNNRSDSSAVPGDPTRPRRSVGKDRKTVTHFNQPQVLKENAVG
jgi:hypothetical protein